MIRWFVLLIVVCPILGLNSNKCLVNHEEVIPKKYFHYESKSLVINLETSSRITHQLSTHIFYIYIKEVLGYPNVAITYNEDYFQIESVIERLTETEDKNTTIPPATINLEVWTSPDYDTLAKEYVKECGNLAPPGRFGWFIPLKFSKPIEQYYQKYLWNNAIKEIHWSFFLDRSQMASFDISEDTFNSVIATKGYNKEKGVYACSADYCSRSMYTPRQCQNQTCAVLLAPEYSATSFLKDQIEETGLLVKVLWLGKNLKQALAGLENYYKSSRYHRDIKSLVIFNWYPSDVVLYEDHFINVQFKNNELYNFTHEKNVGYKYEMHRLVKLAWAKVEKHAYPLYIGLRQFKFLDEDYRFLLDLYEQHSNMTMEHIACEWMKKRQDVWRIWEQTSSEKAVIYIGGIFPMTSSSYDGLGIAKGALLAKDAINSMNILPHYKLNIIVTDGKCSPDIVMKNFIDFIVTKEYYEKLVGVLGPACSETVEPIAGVSKHYHIMVISYSAEGASFSNRENYPYFFRTIGENQHYKHVYIQLFKKYQWKRVAALTEDGQKYTEYISLMLEDFEKNDIKFIGNNKFSREKRTEDMRRALEDLKSKQARIIIADVVDQVARIIMCEAYKLQMTAYEGYVWFLPVWLNATWYDTDDYNAHHKDIVNCTTKQMIHAITGYFTMTHAYWAPEDQIMQENITVGQWRTKHKNVTSPYAGFAYDAVWTYAYALRNLASDPEAISDLHSEKSTNKLVELVKATNFSGVSGLIRFRGGPSRFSVIDIMQWYDNTTHVVGHFHPNLTDDKPTINGGKLIPVESAIRWYTPDGLPPEDGTLPPPSCAVDGLAKAFGVECQTAMIILNVIVAGILLIGVVIVCFYMKRKYDLKVRTAKNYMRSLGFPFDINYANDLDKWEIDRKCVIINRKLGEGAFGTVYGGEANLPDSGWTAVAVKTLKVGSTAEEKLDFLSEAEAMKRFDHKNIVRLLGVCTKEEPVYTIMEFMLYGDLKTYLLARRNFVKNQKIDESEEVSSKRLTNMALDVARGLSYLAELKFVHRDIASRNCLVNAQRTVKIGDFGMTRAMYDNDYYKFTRKGMLPVRWMSPESLALGLFTPATDVWSYGVLIYEVITFGSFPFQGKSNIEVLSLVKEGTTLTIPAEAKPQLSGLLKSCWKKDPKERPTASQIVDYIANNPRLLHPCLDDPVSSIHISDSDQQGMAPEEAFKVSPSKSINGTALQTTQSPIIEEKFDNDGIPLEVCCAKQPLLGPSRSNSNLLNLGRLVNSDNRKTPSGENFGKMTTNRQDNMNV